MSINPEDDIPTFFEGETRPANPAEQWGPFRLIEKVGQGGCGEVYRAWDSTLQREVAVKLLLRWDAGSETEAKAVLREARAMARVRHPNIVSVYGVDRFDGRVGFWSDFVRGRSLADLVKLNGPFGAREAQLIGIEVCKALSAVHAAGLLHRDIKAGNVMREEGGRILLMDFGLTLEEGSGQSIAGTLRYMSPELLAGKPASVASDIYATGVLLFYLVTGKYPVDGETLNDLVSAFKTGSRRSLYEVRPDLPHELAGVIETALKPEPESRFPNAGLMLKALTDAAGAGGSAAVPRTSRRKAWYAAAFAATAIALGTGLVWWRLSPTARAGASAHQAFNSGQTLLDAYYVPGNLDKAAEAFRKTIQMDPTFALAYGGLCRANFLNYRDTSDAKFLKGTEDSCAQALRLDPDFASVHVTLGMLYQWTGRKDPATGEIDTALRLEPNNAEGWAARAELYRSQGRNADVETAYLRAIDLAPRDWRWPNQLGYFYMTQGKLDEAATRFHTAVELSPQNAKPLNQLGMLYRRQNRLPDAEKAFSRAVELLPIGTHILNLGLVVAEEGKLPEAVALYRRALVLNPADFQTWANLADAYRHMPGEEQQAREAYLKAIELVEALKSPDPLVISRLATYYALLGMAEKSEPLIRQSVTLAPADPEILYNAGYSYEALHKRDLALLWITKALEHKYALAAVKQSPDMKALVSDPRFAALDKKFDKKFGA